MTDLTAVGIVAARLMDELAEEYDQATVEAVGVVVDLSFTDDDGDENTSVQWKFARGDGERLSFAHAAGIARILERRMATPVPRDEGEDE